MESQGLTPSRRGNIVGAVRVAVDIGSRISSRPQTNSLSRYGTDIFQSTNDENLNREAVMNNAELGPAAVATRSRHWPIFLAGVLLFVLGPAAYFVQIRMKNLGAPWYVPVVASAGAALMIGSVWRRRGVVRTLILVFFLIVCALEWFTLLIATKSPVYTGPAQPGQRVPDFKTTLADGQPFSEKDLANGTSTALVFYRGHW
jgi:hypothetical protein